MLQRFVRAAAWAMPLPVPDSKESDRLALDQRYRSPLFADVAVHFLHFSAISPKGITEVVLYIPKERGDCDAIKVVICSSVRWRSIDGTEYLRYAICLVE